MGQVQVKKTTTNGKDVQSRLMTFSDVEWERIVSRAPEVGVVWERVGAAVVEIKETVLTPSTPKVSTKPVIVEKEIINEVSKVDSSNEFSQEVNYDNYSEKELRELAKSSQIKGYQVMGKKSLIKKLQENGKSGSN